MADSYIGELDFGADAVWLLLAAPVARDVEVRTLIEDRRLFGRGIGFVDVSLLASCLLAPGTSIWTRDSKLEAVARDLGVAQR